MADPIDEILAQALGEGSGSGSSNTQIIQGNDGRYYLVNKTTGEATLLDIPAGANQSDRNQALAGQPIVDPTTGWIVGFYDDAGNRRYYTEKQVIAVNRLGGTEAGATETPSQTALRQAQTEEAQARTGRIGIQNQLTQAQIATEQAQLLAAQQKMLPQQIAAIENHLAMIDYAEQQIASGRMSPQEAEQFLQQSRALTDASLRGTTPYQIEQDRIAQRRADQSLGRQILDDRLTASRGIADSILSSAVSLAGNALPQPGQKFNIPIFSAAPGLADQMGGGAEVTNFARQLLLQAGGGQASQPAQPMGQGDFPMTREEVLRQHPELAGVGG